MPTSLIQNSGQVWGTSSLSGYTGDDRWSVTETFIASGTINRGDIAALSTSSGYVIQCATNTNQSLMIGVCCATVTSGQTVAVVIYGPFYGAKKGTAALTVGTDFFLTRSATVTAGFIALSTATTIATYADLAKAIATPMSTQTAGDSTIDVFVCRPMG